MAKVTIFSGFLGAGKTTLIKKLIQEGYQGEQLVLIENEFGQIGIDGGFLKDSGIQINEMNSGCICCSLVGDFSTSLKQVLDEYHPDRILIEPSGVGKLSDVIRAVQNVGSADLELDGFAAVVDAKKCKMYQKNFGEFFNNQIEYASCLILSHTTGLSEDKIQDTVDRLRALNKTAPIVTTEWDALTGQQLIQTITQKDTLEQSLETLLAEAAHAHHHDHDHEHEHHHDHDHEHEHHHDHDHEHEHHHDHDHEHEHHHDHDHEHEHHHDHDHEHEHHHDHGPDCTCGCHDHDHDHHHHHADEVFTSWGTETAKQFSQTQIADALAALQNEDAYGVILRAKGIVAGENGQWIHFDYIPGTPDVRTGSAETTGRICVIGSKLNEEAVAALFGTK